VHRAFRTAIDTAVLHLFAKREHCWVYQRVSTYLWNVRAVLSFLNSPGDGVPDGIGAAILSPHEDELGPRSTVGASSTAAITEVRAIGTDALVVDASMRQALAATRSLGRSGLRVWTAESPDLPNSRRCLPAFASRWSDWNAYLPSYYGDPDLYASSVLRLANRCGALVVIPSSDGSIAALHPWRARFERQGVALAIASEVALSIANDKQRTLDVAGGLGIRGPRSLPVRSLEDARSVLREIGYPAVIKPTKSWVSAPSSSARVTARVVIDEAEALEFVDGLCELGSQAVVQQWVGGRRDAVNIFYAEGQVRAAIAQVAYRTAPVLGGVSVVRETIPMADDLLVPAISLVEALDLEGYSEVEFRRDLTGRPLVMEINARLTAGIELAIRSGVDFPTMAWRWAAKQSVPTLSGYRTGVRMRFLSADLEWLWENFKQQGRPDSVSRLTASRIFARDFFRPQAYDYVDRGDLKPTLVAVSLHLNQVRQRIRVKYGDSSSKSCNSLSQLSEDPRV
jgi:predicted ATP-grasp superfamily ATP-dependent carboligase